MSKEIERRFLVRTTDIDCIIEYKSVEIDQGYLYSGKNNTTIRVRNSKENLVSSERSCTMTIKRGVGLVRDEHEYEIPEDLACTILDVSPLRLSKTRYFLPDRWTLDDYQGTLRGIYMLEVELPTETTDLPPFPRGVEILAEVTGIITNYTLAELAAVSHQNVSVEDVLKFAAGPDKVPVIVLTGGPCSGKSSLIAALKSELPDVFFVPEAATLIMQQVGVTPPADTVGLIEFQRRLTTFQQVLEASAQMHAIRNGYKAIVLDRGIFDNAAYFPGRLADFLRATHLDMQEVQRRYDKVLCISTPPKTVVEENIRNNPVRLEASYQDVLYASERTRSCWTDHPGLVTVPNNSTFSALLQHVVSDIVSLL